jgi:hypothetical protein
VGGGFESLQAYPSFSFCDQRDIGSSGVRAWPLRMADCSKTVVERCTQSTFFGPLWLSQELSEKRHVVVRDFTTERIASAYAATRPEPQCETLGDCSSRIPGRYELGPLSKCSRVVFGKGVYQAESWKSRRSEDRDAPCLGFYRGVCRVEALFRQVAGGWPTRRLNARLKAYSDSYPIRAATSPALILPSERSCRARCILQDDR